MGYFDDSIRAKSSLTSWQNATDYFVGVTDTGTKKIAGTLVAGLTQAQTWSELQSFNDGKLALKGLTSGSLLLKAAAIAGSSVITFPAGTTDFSATGGSSRVVKQTSAGGAFTVAQLANTDITGLGTLSTQNASAIAVTGGTIAGLTGFGIRDTSASFDVTIAAVSSPALGAGRILTLDMSNVAHTLDFGSTANTITFPSASSYTVAGLSVAGTWSATQTSMVLSGATLTGATVIPGSGAISSGGDLHLGGAGAARIDIQGTYTSANANLVRLSGTHASSITTTQRGVVIGTTFAPSGASLTAMLGLSVSPILNSTAFTITEYENLQSSFTLGASFSGIISTAYMMRIYTPGISGGSITNLEGLRLNSFTNGDGITSGTVTNIGIQVNSMSAAAGVGGTIVNTAAKLHVPSSSSAGNTDRGLWITGNGGASSTKYALDSDSTALSRFSGPVSVLYLEPSVGNALTATGSARTDALQLAKQINNLTTVASGTGVILPVGVVGMEIDVFNNGANALKVYASASETIDTVAGSTGVTLTNAKRCRYYFVAANTWISAQWGVISA